MSPCVLTRQLALVPALSPAALLEVPPRIGRRAQLRGWASCDVCTWPVVPAAMVLGRTPRHPGCVCCVCDAPLLAEQLEPGVVWHPQCRRAAARPVLAVVGGAR